MPKSIRNVLKKRVGHLLKFRCPSLINGMFQLTNNSGENTHDTSCLFLRGSSTLESLEMQGLQHWWYLLKVDQCHQFACSLKLNLSQIVQLYRTCVIFLKELSDETLRFQVLSEVLEIGPPKCYRFNHSPQSYLPVEDKYSKTPKGFHFQI